MDQDSTKPDADAPLSYARIPAVIFKCFRDPAAAIRAAEGPNGKLVLRRFRMAPAGGTRGLHLVLSESFAGSRLIDAKLMAMDDAPEAVELVKDDPELKRHVLLYLVIGGEEDKSIWARGRGFWVRYCVHLQHSGLCRELGIIPETWRRCLHEIELFADKLTRKHAGAFQGFWQGELDPRCVNQQKPEGSQGAT